MKNVLVASLVALSLTACSSLSDALLGQSTSADGTTFKGGQSYSASEERKFVTSIGDRVLFGYDSSALSAQGTMVLSEQAKWLKSKSGVKIVIEGHADERGTREYNLALGERRANAIQKFLVSQGISADRIMTVSYGKERPAVASSNKSAWAQNRRGVTVLTD